ILRTIADAAGLDMPSDDPRPRGREPAIVAIDSAREVNDLVSELFGDRIDLRALIPAGMFALGIYSFLYHKDTRLPRWDNLVYWSYSVFYQQFQTEIGESAAQTHGGVP